MTITSRRSFIAGLAAVAAAGSGAPAPAAAAARRIRWSKSGLDAFRTEARNLRIEALVVRSGGSTIVSEGEVATPLRVASVRKSILSALYGVGTANGSIKLDARLSDLHIQDYTSLTEAERSATVRQLLQARSGIYLPAAAEPATTPLPRRGTHAPGSYWLYKNWDFNVLGEIFQRQTGLGLFTAFEHQLARPLGLQDFDPLRHTRWTYADWAPRFPAYEIHLSARDMAKFGELFLDGGRRENRQLLPAEWVQESTRSYSETRRPGLFSGYGYMWWVAAEDGPLSGSYMAAGNGGRFIVVMPHIRTVVAIQHRDKPGQPPVPIIANPRALTALMTTLTSAATV